MEKMTKPGFRLWTGRGPDETLFVTVVFDGASTPHETIAACYREISTLLQSRHMCIVQERLFGCLARRESVWAARDEGLDSVATAATSPVMLQGAPVHDGPLAGILIRAVRKTTVSLIEVDGEAVGCRWRRRGTEYLVLPAMTFPRFGDDADPTEITKALLSRCERMLVTVGFSFRDVFRTWFYLCDILTWYDAFNVGRSDRYNAFGITPTGRRAPLRLPASTGIGVDNESGGAGVLALLAKRGEVPLTQMSNPGQKDAFRYGSAFSRGALLTYPGGKLFELSGTAAIDETGTTVHLSNPKGQIDCTFDKIETLISQAGLSMHHLAGGAAFLKHAEDYPHLTAALAEKGYADLPLIPMQAEVCRDNLLFEIDGAFVSVA